MVDWLRNKVNKISIVSLKLGSVRLKFYCCQLKQTNNKRTTNVKCDI